MKSKTVAHFTAYGTGGLIFSAYVKLHVAVLTANALTSMAGGIDAILAFIIGMVGLCCWVILYEAEERS